MNRVIQLMGLISIVLICMGCNEPDPVANVAGMDVYCTEYRAENDRAIKETHLDHCPDLGALELAYENNRRMWDAHLESVGHNKDYDEIMSRYDLSFFRGIDGLAYGALGITSHSSGYIKILVTECEPHEDGLCPGIFDWEMGLPPVESLMPHSTEREKIDYRLDNDLVYPDRE